MINNRIDGDLIRKDRCICGHIMHLHVLDLYSCGICEFTKDLKCEIFKCGCKNKICIHTEYHKQETINVN